MPPRPTDGGVGVVQRGVGAGQAEQRVDPRRRPADRRLTHEDRRIWRIASQASQIEAGVGAHRPGQIPDLQPFELPRLGRLAIAVQGEGLARRHDHRQASGQGAEPQADRPRPGLGASGDGGKAGRAPQRDHKAVLPGQRRQGEEGEGEGDQAPAARATIPNPRRPGQGGETGDSGVGEQHILPDIALIGQQQRRRAQDGGQDDRGEARSWRKRREGEQAAKAQHRVEHDEARRAGADGVEPAEQPGHHRRMPGVEDAAAPLLQLPDRVGRKLSRPAQPQAGRRAGRQHQRQGGEADEVVRRGPTRHATSLAEIVLAVNRPTKPRHPGRSEAETRDPGADAQLERLGPGSTRLRRSGRDDGRF